MNLSIIIPVLNERKKIGRDIEAAAEFLHKNELEGEIIVVDDGSTDGTSEAAEQMYRVLPEGIKFKVIRLEHHRGKGYAVRAGVKESRGDYVMFADSGSCVPYAEVLKGVDLIDNEECDIAHGSRRIRGSYIHKEQGLYRWICARLFHFFVIWYMRLPKNLSDTQCGFKIYRGDVARKLYGESFTDGFMFDIEIIMRAKRAGYKIKEFAIDWTCDRDTRVKTRGAFEILRELVKLKRTFDGEVSAS